MPVDHQAHCYNYGIKAKAHSPEALHKRIIKLTPFKNEASHFAGSCSSFKWRFTGAYGITNNPSGARPKKIHARYPFLGGGTY